VKNKPSSGKGIKRAIGQTCFLKKKNTQKCREKNAEKNLVNYHFKEIDGSQTIRSQISLKTTFNI